jgi:hypothetical protein
MRRAKTSTTNATYCHPCQVETFVKSDTQSYWAGLHGTADSRGPLDIARPSPAPWFEPFSHDACQQCPSDASAFQQCSVLRLAAHDVAVAIPYRRRRPACFLPNLLNLRHEKRIPFRSRALQFRVAALCCMTPVAGRGNLQDLAKWLYPITFSVLVDKRANYFNRRSSSAWAKNALASLRISLARRNSLTSFSSALTRSCSALVTPERDPVSTSCRRTHSFSVCGTQPIFGAIDSIAAHNDRYPHGALAPYERRAHAPQAKICFASSWLHSLR